MHLSCHLLECVEDYGPLHGFWCFGFERFNGILGSYPNNNRDVSITMMKKVLDEIALDFTMVNPVFQQFIVDMSAQKMVGSLKESVSSTTSIHLLQPFTESVLSSTLIHLLTDMYRMFYGETLRTVSQICTKSARLSFRCHTLCSALARTERGSCIAAYWNTSREEIHIGIVQFYFEHNIVVKEQITKHTVAFVNWFEVHPDRYLFNPPLEIWADSVASQSPSSFVPVSNILYPVAFAKSRVETQFGNETVVITYPLTYIF